MLIILLYAWIALLGVVVIFWLLFLKTANPSIIDCGWSLGVFLASTVFILINNHFPPNKVVGLYWFLLFLWATRLSGYILITRVLKNEIDKRYLQISDDWVNKQFGFLMHYVLQSLLMLIVAIPFYFIAQIERHTITLKEIVISGCILLFLIGESIADYQLSRFKNKKTDEVCDKGLWAYSRHPNYFFEWMIWLMFAVGTVSNKQSLLSLLSPLFLWYLFVFITGPISERASIKSKGFKYLEYQKRTAMFIPWFVKRN